ncbi:MAG TPA: sensor histidine kinase [Solirubrobacteraceae bacterium]|nr:sensor histidine kinase [Solirubrobacteraceae bacterium]
MTLPSRGHEDEHRYIPLFWRLFVPNATVLGAAGVVLMIEPANGRLIALAGGFLTMLGVNLILMRRAFAPLARLTALMGRVDPLNPGERIRVPGPKSEVSLLAHTLNEMLDRLEAERRESARRTLSAQETERRHLAAELHDEIGQTLTALVLQLTRVVEQSTDGTRAAAREARDTTLQLVDDVRAIARQLRPEALDALGLPAALTSLAERFSERTKLPMERSVQRDLPSLSHEAELVLYRVAQESLTNIVRHANATRARLSLRADAEGVVLTVRDDGTGFSPDDVEPGGIRIMRERALLVGGELTIGAPPDGDGLQVQLRVGWEEGLTDGAADGETPPR